MEELSLNHKDQAGNIQVEKILGQQLLLLAEASKSCEPKELPELTYAMLKMLESVQFL